jgi:uncharacterized RDD family membrane protein YckC
MKTRRNASPRAWPLLVLLACVMAMLCSPASLQSATMEPLQPTPPPMIALADDAFAWVIYPTPRDPSAPESADRSWTVLRRKLGSTPERYWTTYARLAAAPVDAVRFGERLIVLYADGVWSIVGRDVETAGPLPANGRVIDVSVSPEGRIRLRVQDGVDISAAESDGRRLKAIEADVPPTPIELPRDRDDFVAQIGDERVRVPLSRFAARPVAATVENGQIVAWWLGEDGLPRFQTVTSDGVVSPTSDSVNNAARVSPPMFERVLYVIGAGTFLLVLLIGGRQTLQTDPTQKPVLPPKPAPLARRLAAGVVDLFPLVAVILYLAWRGHMTSVAGMLSFDGPMSEAILGAAVLLYIVLMLSMELRYGASLGKMAFALRVTSLDGSPPGVKNVVIRNVLRLVDLNLITLVFVPLTPLRQRIGDFIAATMVVDAADVRSPAPQQKSADDLADK